MISDIVWRCDVNTKGEHVGSYISPVADRMLGLPIGITSDITERKAKPVQIEGLAEMLARQ